MLNFEKAIALGFKTVTERRERANKQNVYVLEYANDTRNVAGKFEGHTLVGLAKKFLAMENKYQYAVIVKKGKEDVFLRVYDRKLGGKFISFNKRKNVVK